MDSIRIKEANDAFDALKMRKFKDVTLEELRKAGSGIYYDYELFKKSSSHLLECLQDAAKNDDTLGIYPDSVTAHQNYGAAKFGLRISDIQALKPGDTMELIVFCRNTGDMTHGKPKGTRWDLLSGLKAATCYSTAKYTHYEGMRGHMNFNGFVHENFEWEVNGVRATNNRAMYWTPLYHRHQEDVEAKRDDPEDLLTWDMFDQKTRVGWRGPMVRVEDLKKFPIQHVTHYDNFWNDYGVIEHFDLTDCE